MKILPSENNKLIVSACYSGMYRYETGNIDTQQRNTVMSSFTALFPTIRRWLSAKQVLASDCDSNLESEKKNRRQSKIIRNLPLVLSDRLINFGDPKFPAKFLETIVITIVGLLLGNFFLPNAPLFATQGFTWFIVGPLLSGLRYGSRYGLLSVVLSLGVLAVGQSYQLPWATGSLPTIGLVLIWIAYIAGEFRNYWERRIEKLSVTTRNLDQKLREISKAYSLTKISHDRLQELVVSKVSLRDGIQEVRNQIANASTQNGHLREIGATILKVFSDYVDIQMASFHEVENDLQINPKPIVSLGNRLPIDLNNPLLKEAVRTKKTVSLNCQLITDTDYNGSPILVIPIVDATKKLWGIVAVHKMSFRSYRPDNIKSLSFLAGYIGDLIGKRVCSASPELEDRNLHDFSRQLHRCIEDTSNYNTSSVIFGIESKYRPTYGSLSKLLAAQVRDFDQIWGGINRHGNPVWLLLLPLTTSEAADAFKNKLRGLSEEISTVPATDILFHKIVLLATDNAMEAMSTLATMLRIDLPWHTNTEEQKIYAIK